MRKPHLLLIVDDWELLERYEERFAEAFDVDCAPLGSEGIRMAAVRKPDLVVLHLAFENMTNAEVAAAFHADPQIRFVPILQIDENEREPLTSARLTEVLRRAHPST